jgi:hypothetical protein
MADRIIVGDTPRLANLFYVDGTLTDPTTVTLTVTDPSAAATVYTYPADITKSSTGSYYKDVAVAEDGVWGYTWTGTGLAADVADGTFTVWPLPSEGIDVLTLTEAKQAVGLEQTNTSHDDYLRTLISTWTTDGDYSVNLPPPVYSITTVTEYNQTAATVLTAETNTVKTSGNYLHDGVEGTIYSGTVRRRSSGSDYCFPTGRKNVVAVYVKGRAANTEVVPAKFKQAASVMLLDIWRRQQASGSQTIGALIEEGINPLLGPGILNMVAGFIGDDMIDAVRWVNA